APVGATRNTCRAEAPASNGFSEAMVLSGLPVPVMWPVVISFMITAPAAARTKGGGVNDLRDDSAVGLLHTGRRLGGCVMPTRIGHGGPRRCKACGLFHIDSRLELALPLAIRYAHATFSAH